MARVPVRMVTSLAVAAVSAVVVAAAIDVGRIPFALVITGLVTPAMVAFALLDATGRPRTARIAYLAWSVSWLGFFGLSTLGTRGSTDGSAELARMSLMAFAAAAIAGFGWLAREQSKSS
jgi:hypothetical protein